MILFRLFIPMGAPCEIGTYSMIDYSGRCPDHTSFNRALEDYKRQISSITSATIYMTKYRSPGHRVLNPTRSIQASVVYKGCRYLGVQLYVGISYMDDLPEVWKTLSQNLLFVGLVVPNVKYLHKYAGLPQLEAYQSLDYDCNTAFIINITAYNSKLKPDPEEYPPLRKRYTASTTIPQSNPANGGGYMPKSFKSYNKEQLTPRWETNTNHNYNNVQDNSYKPTNDNSRGVSSWYDKRNKHNCQCKCSCPCCPCYLRRNAAPLPNIKREEEACQSTLTTTGEGNQRSTTNQKEVREDEGCALPKGHGPPSNAMENLSRDVNISPNSQYGERTSPRHNRSSYMMQKSCVSEKKSEGLHRSGLPDSDTPYADTPYADARTYADAKTSNSLSQDEDNHLAVDEKPIEVSYKPPILSSDRPPLLYRSARVSGSSHSYARLDERIDLREGPIDGRSDVQDNYSDTSSTRHSEKRVKCDSQRVYGDRYGRDSPHSIPHSSRHNSSYNRTHISAYMNGRDSTVKPTIVKYESLHSDPEVGGNSSSSRDQERNGKAEYSTMYESDPAGYYESISEFDHFEFGARVIVDSQAYLGSAHFDFFGAKVNLGRADTIRSTWWNFRKHAADIESLLCKQFAPINAGGSSTSPVLYDMVEYLVGQIGYLSSKGESFTTCDWCQKYINIGKTGGEDVERVMGIKGGKVTFQCYRCYGTAPEFIQQHKRDFEQFVLSVKKRGFFN